MQVPSLDQEDPLEEEMATHSSILAREISWTEEPGGLQSMGSQLDTTEHAHTLVVQWLRIHAAMQASAVQSRVREDPTCHRAAKPMR